jgi:hypothetical protein
MDQNPQDTLKAINKLLQDTENRSKGIAAKFQEVNKSLVDFYSKTKDEASAALAQTRDTADSAKLQLNYLFQREAAGHRITDQQKLASMQALLGAQKEISIQEKLINFAVKRDFYLKESVPTLALVAKLLDSTIEANSKLNQTLLESNSTFSARYRLVNSIYEIQKETGASLETMGDSARALVSYGQELDANWKSNLKTVVMLRDGLGVSAEHGAELVNLFERRLRIPARDVGDSIARIANNTSIAADQAARFSIEIGRTLSLMGPGIGKEAVRVNEVVIKMAGQMRELGGNAEDVVKLFQELGKGTPEGFQMRGFGHVNVNQISTPQGTRQAFEGIGRLIEQIVKAPPGTEAYVAQLEAAAAATRTNTELVRFYNEALRGSSKPLTESQQLEERYRNQMQLTGNVILQFRTSVGALLHEALLPLLKLGTPILRVMANFVQTLVEFKPTVYAITAAVVASSAAASVGLYSVVRALWAVAGTSGLLSKGASLLGLPVGALQNVLQNVLRFTGLASFTPTLQAIGSRLIALLTRLSPYAIAFAVGWSIGKLVDSLLNRMGIDLSKTFQRFFKEKNQTYQGVYGGGNLTVGGFDAYFRELGLKGATMSPEKIADQVAIKLKSIRNIDLGRLSDKQATEAVERAVNSLAQGAYFREIGRTTELTQEDRAENEKVRLMMEQLKSAQSMTEIMKLIHKAALLQQERDKVANQESGTWSEFKDMLLNSDSSTSYRVPSLAPGY